ncbi:hypothetical protein HanPI659440_Chr16g0619731 [Helianthus annuus]|nr:hypothetical protein HanPI659440_Chr16g0619731 [Helianthus annuus]
MMDDIFLYHFRTTIYIKMKITTITMITQISTLMISTTNFTVPIVLPVPFVHQVMRLDEVKSMTNLTNVFQSFWKLCTKFMNKVVTTMTTRVVIPMIPVDVFPTSGT